MHPLDARASGTSATRAIGTIPAHRREIVPFAGLRRAVRRGIEHVSQKCICVSPVMLSKKAPTELEVDPEPELVLEFDKAAELTELLGVLFAAES